MNKANDLMLFPNLMKKRELERAQYIELKRYSKKVYKREIITNLIVVLTILGLVISIGAITLCGLF